MTGKRTIRASRGRARASEEDVPFDRELADLPAALRWREWMMRAEAVMFASGEPVTRETLARVVGPNCSIDLLIDDLQSACQLAFAAAMPSSR